MTNKKIFLFVMMSVFLIIGLSAVTAGDISDNSTNADTSDVIQEMSTSTHVESQTPLQQEKKTQESTETIDNTANNNIQKDEKSIKNAKTIIINNQTFNTYFKDKYLNDKVSPGDTLDFRGNFFGEQYSMIIDKPINMISSTKDTNITLNTSAEDWFGGDDVAAFTVVNGGSYTNISDIYFYNSQIFIKNASHMIINNISAIVDNRPVGRGVGQTAIRDNSSFITLENSTISTTNNGGSTSLALSWVNNCTIRNNLIQGIGKVGNIFYLNTFNVENLPLDSQGRIDFTIVNTNNTIENNILIGTDEPEDICYGICLSGSNNLVRNNTINYKGQGINPMYEIYEYDMNTTIVNNTLNGCNFLAGVGLTIINNTVTGYLSANKNCTILNNNIGLLQFSKDNLKISNNTLGGVYIQNNRKNITIENCTITDNITLKGSSRTNVPTDITITKNQINGNVYLNGTNGLTLSNNNITEQVIMGTRNYNQNINIKNNNITNDKEYSIIINTTLNGEKNISDNVLSTKNSTGYDTIYQPTTTNLDAVKGFAGKPVTINANVKDALNNNVKYGIVTFTDNATNTLGTVNVTNGVASITYNYTAVGLYRVTANYTNSPINKDSTARATVTIIEINLEISGSPVALTKSNITVKVTDENNKPVTNGSVAVKVNNVAQAVTFNEGIATVSYTPQNTNPLNISATYTTDDNLTINKTSTLKVAQISTKTTLTSVKGFVGQTLTLNATVKDANNNNVKDGIVTFTDNTGKTLGSVKVSNGVASTTVNYNAAGIYNITASYSNSTTYKSSTSKSTATISKVNLEIQGSLTALTKGNITVKVTDENNKAVTTGSVAVKVNNVAQSVSFKNGVATVSYTPQNTNKLDVAAAYTTADKYTVNKTATLNVAQISTKATVTSAKGLIGQKLAINATVKDANNNNVKDGVVVFVDNTGKTLATVKVSNGIASTTISYNTAGVYNITASYSNASVYKSSTAKSTVTIGKVNIAINGSLTALTKGDITVKVTDENNKAVTTGSVAVKVNNVAQTVSFKNGIATVSYTPQNTNKLNVAATYTTADKYTVSNTSTLTVAKINTKTTITSNNTKPRVNDKVKLTITLKDNNNNVVANKNLTITVNNKNYNVTTDKTGIATVNYTMNKNYANLTANANFAGDNTYKDSKGTLTLNRTFTTDVKLLTGSFDAKPGDTVKLIAHITDNGLDINGGQLVFKIDGKTLADASGKAVKVNIKDGFAILEYKIPDTLSAGTRNLSATFSSGKYSGRLSTPMVINKLVTHIDVNPLYTTGNTIQVKAQVVDQNNQALNKQTAICIKFNGKSYNFNTATGTINYQISQTLKDGYYNLTIISGANGKYLSSTVNTVVVKTKTTIKTNYINNTLNNRSTANSGDIKTGKYMSLLTGASTVKPGDTLKLIAHVTTGGVDITGGQLGFKIDGLTLNDSKNNKVFHPKDGLAILEYKVPDTLSAGTRTLSTVYSSKTYGDERLNSTLTMNKLNTHIEAQPIYTTSTTPTIQATILDDNNELINKQTKVVIKIDGKSYTINNDNGKISYKVPSKLSQGLHQITIIAGENGKYLSSRANTVIIKT